MQADVFRDPRHEEYFKKQYMKSAVLDYPPQWVTLGICSPCPYRCEFCAYHSLDAKNISRVFNVRFKMPFELAKSIIDFLYAGGVPRIHLCATGEPLWHPDFFAIFDYVANSFGSVSFQSNFPASLVKERNVLRKLLARKDKIAGITVDLMGNSSIKGGDSEFLYETLSRITSASDVRIGGNFLITRLNWKDLETVVRDIHRWKLKVSVRAARVFPHGMNAFTDPANAWSGETVTRDEKAGLEEILSIAKSLKVRVYIPQMDAGVCDVFWKKLQIWPTRGSEPGRLDNLVPHGCNAVVLGNMDSLGYLGEYPDVFSLWNNPELVKIRSNLLSGIYPDAHCAKCPYHG